MDKIYAKPTIRHKGYLYRDDDGSYILYSDLDKDNPIFDCGKTLEMVAFYLYTMDYGLELPIYARGLISLVDIEFNLTDKDMNKLKELEMIEKL